MSALRKLISGSAKAGACGKRVLEPASHDQGALCRQVCARPLHGSPALLMSKCPGASAVTQQPGRAGLRTSLPLTKPVMERPGAPPNDRPQVRVHPSLLNLQDSGDRPPSNQPGRTDSQSRDSRHQ